MKTRIAVGAAALLLVLAIGIVRVLPPETAVSTRSSQERSDPPAADPLGAPLVAPIAMWAAPPASSGAKLDPKSARCREALARGERLKGRSAPFPAASMIALETLRQGDAVAVPLFDGEQLTGRVDLVREETETGWVRVSGMLTGPRKGSFLLGRSDKGVSAFVLLPDEDLAYKVETLRDGQVLLREAPLSEVVALAPPLPPKGSVRAASSGAKPAGVPPLLSSRPEATAVIYIDFDGESGIDTFGNPGGSLVYPPADLTESEIVEVWKGVKEDFLPFDIDVTTDASRYAHAPVGRRMCCIVTSVDALGGLGGWAWPSSFALAGQSYPERVCCLASVFTAVETALAISHEVGHTLALGHHGRRNPPEEYYEGHGSGAVSWSPIMGGFGGALKQWSMGEYANASQPGQDDVAIIAGPINGAGFAADDAGDTIATAACLHAPAGAVLQAGEIGKRTDVDLFAFNVVAGHLEIRANPAAVFPNVDILLELRDASGKVIASSNPETALEASLSADVGAGTWYLAVQGAGLGDVLGTGYSNYGCLGAYTLSGTIPGPAQAPVVTSPAVAAGTVGCPFRYAIAASASPVEYTVAGPLPEGLALDPATGEITGTPGPETAGNRVVTVSASNAVGTGAKQVAISITQPWSFAEALDAPRMAWVSSGDAPWTAQTARTHDGLDAARSGSIGRKQASSLCAQVTGPVQASFWWKTDSEAGCDILGFFIDGVLQGSISGNTDWTQTSFGVPTGSHRIEWRYTKDGSANAGLDAAWLDEVAFGPLPVPAITSPATAAGTCGEPFSFRIAAASVPKRYEVTGSLPPGTSLDPATGEISGTPASAGVYHVTVGAVNDTGTGTSDLAIAIAAGIISLGEALDAPAPIWGSRSDVPRYEETLWHGQNQVSFDGVDAAQSGIIGDNMETRVSALLVGPATVTFRWKVDSEDEHDFLRVAVGQATIASISGKTGWLAASVEIPAGPHQLDWIYEKDDSIAVGADAGWVDAVTITTSHSRLITLSGDLDFGEVPVGSTAQRILTIGNPGTDTLTLDSINWSEPFSGPCPSTIPPGTSRDVAVTFAPTKEGPCDSTPSLFCDATTGPIFKITLKGVGIGPRPPNDSLSGCRTLAGPNAAAIGTNVQASREPGEPDLSGSPNPAHGGGRSVWWSWTAPVSSPTTVSTFGSSFDTLLAVFTGTTIGDLALVAAGDDDGDARTSRARFDAVAGTTYFIGVDGYGGATGSIALRIRQVPPVPAVIARDPAPQRVVAGQPAVFSLVADGVPQPSFRWQRSSDGGATWTDLSTHGPWTGIDADTLTIHGTTADMDGDRLRCVVANGLGPDAASRPARLSVVPLADADPTWVFSHLAGNTRGIRGARDGTGPAAAFASPVAIAIAADGALYVADTDANAVRKITPGGVVTTLSAAFNQPRCLATRPPSDLFVVDRDGDSAVVRKAGPSGAVAAIAQGGFSCPGLAVDALGDLFLASDSDRNIGKILADGTVAEFTAAVVAPSDIAAGSSGRLFLTDPVEDAVFEISPTGEVAAFAGRPSMPGHADGAGSAARFSDPSGLAVDAAGNLYVADAASHTIRKIAADGSVATLAGAPGCPGAADGLGAAAHFDFRHSTRVGVAVDASGEVFVTDTNNLVVRQVSPEGKVTTLAGSLAGKPGRTDGRGHEAAFRAAKAVAVDAAGNCYVADTGNGAIRKITPDGAVTTIAEGLAGPEGVAVDSAGTVWVADTARHVVGTIGPDRQFAVVAGEAGHMGAGDGTGAAARFHTPTGLAVDSTGVVWVADTGNHTVRKIAPGGAVTTVGGSPGQPGAADGTGSAARFDAPEGVAAGSAGVVFVADTQNHTIRRISPAGDVATIAGSPSLPGSNDGTGSAARFFGPAGLAVDAAGNIFVCDQLGHAVRRVAPGGIATTIGGLPGPEGLGSTDGIGPAARFKNPRAIALDAAGNIYIADPGDHVIRKGTLRLGPIASPAAVAQPADRTVDFGEAAGFVAEFTGAEPLLRRWQRRGAASTQWTDLPDGSAYSGAHTASLTVTRATMAMNGDRLRCVVADGANPDVASAEAILTVRAPVSVPPLPAPVATGSRCALSCGLTHGAEATAFQWQIRRTAGGATALGRPKGDDGWIDIRGATRATFTIPSAQAFHAAEYRVVATIDGVPAASEPVSLEVSAPAPSAARPLNLSTRALCLTGDDVLIPGFVVDGTGTKRLLMRAVGPELARYGVATFLSDPQMRLEQRQPGQSWLTLAQNDDWGTNANAADIAPQAALLGAFPLDPGSKSAVLLRDVPAGIYTIVASGKPSSGSGQEDTGVAIVELYDADSASATARLINISNRGYVGTGTDIMIPGFVVSHEGARTFLIRAVGPTLSRWVTGVLSDPMIQIYGTPAPGQEAPLLLANDTWGENGDDAAIRAAATTVGAFPLDEGSADAAFVVTLPPGAYTVHGCGVAGATGIALVEVYLVP